MNDPVSSTPHTLEASSTVELASRLAFLEMTDADRQRVRKLAPLLKAGGDEFVEAFYRHLFAFDETAKFLRNAETVERLKRLQQAHFQSMLEDDLDDAYVARRRRVGDIHAQIGINPQMYLGAYNQYLQFGLRQMAAKQDTALPEFVEQVLSLLKAIFLDVELTLEAYFSQATRELQQALDMVFRANTELRQFAQLTSHDLKTPLATVANLCDEALDEFRQDMPAEACQLIELAKQRTYRMSTMIDELLELSAPPEDFEARSEVSSEQVIAEVLDRLRLQLEQRCIEVSVASDLPTLWGNRVRLREAFYNILSNAAKYIDKHPGQIRITTELTQDECKFAITDNGPGIPREDLERIFSPFRRVAMHQDRPGSGLGLYFTRNLIEQENGRVWAESDLGQGCTFYVALKRRTEETGSA